MKPSIIINIFICYELIFIQICFFSYICNVLSMSRESRATMIDLFYLEIQFDFAIHHEWFRSIKSTHSYLSLMVCRNVCLDFDYNTSQGEWWCYFKRTLILGKDWGCYIKTTWNDCWDCLELWWWCEWWACFERSWGECSGCFHNCGVRVDLILLENDHTTVDMIWMNISYLYVHVTLSFKLHVFVRSEIIEIERMRLICCFLNWNGKNLFS